MTALILDAGAFVAIENDDLATIALLREAQREGKGLRTSAIVVSQVWRDQAGCQAKLSRILRSVDVRTVDLDLALHAGALVGRAGTDDPIDATIVIIAEAGDGIVTSDPNDIRRLIGAAGKRVAIIPC